MVASRKSLGLALIIISIFCSVTALAQNLTPEQEKQAQYLFDTVFSPFCPGRLLRDCPSYKAHELKDQIKSELAGGKNIDQITQDLYVKFGNSIKALPETSGFGLLAWLAPGLFLLAGAIILITWVRSRKVNALSSKQVQLSPEMRARIEKELGN